jgi:hypothetical protein
MAGVIVFPHLTARREAVMGGPWMRCLPNGTREQVLEYIKTWDPGTVLSLVRTVRVDVSRVFKECDLDADARIAVTSQWYSRRTSLRGMGQPIQVNGSTDELELSLEIAPGVSGGTLVLRTQLLLLGSPGSKSRPFTPVHIGAILWQDRCDIALEGIGARFPVEVWKFSGLIPPEAGWMLDWRPTSPEALFMGSVRLLLNESHKAVVEAATSPTPDTTQKHIRSAIYADVARSLISGMLQNDDFVGGATFDKGTVGQVVGDLLAHAFPGEDRPIVKKRLEREPDLFSACIQARFKQFHVS